jgi:uncharacterized protein YcbX
MSYNHPISLGGIHIYPVKSMGGVSLNESQANINGFSYDRKWMLVDENGIFMSQREYPELAKFRLSMIKEGFSISFDSENITIPFTIDTKKYKEVRIWEDMVKATLASDKYHAWFSEKLNYTCSLVHIEPHNERKVDPYYAKNDEKTGFSDGFPYLMISEGSLEILNQKLINPLPMNRFRPNIVISNDNGFIEDTIQIFTIGSARFKVAKPCARCVITTTDQNTGKRDKEPLKTLATFRKKGNKVLFGQNVICIKEGRVSIGDEVIIHSVKTGDIE